MKRIAALIAVALFLAACSDPASDGSVQPVTTGTPVADLAATTTTVEPTTTTVQIPTSTTAPTTTTTTLATLQGLSYEQVATAGFPMALIPDAAGDRDLVLTRVGLVSDLATGDVVLDISAKTRTDGERGLLWGVVGPADLGDALFLHYSDRNGDTTVSRFDRTDAGFDIDSERILFQVELIMQDSVSKFMPEVAEVITQELARTLEAHEILSRIQRAEYEQGYTYTLPDRPGPFQVEVDLWYQAMGARYVAELFRYPTPEVDRFRRGYEAVSPEPVRIASAGSVLSTD